jgi:hypothetical protein
MAAGQHQKQQASRISNTGNATGHIDLCNTQGAVLLAGVAFKGCRTATKVLQQAAGEGSYTMGNATGHIDLFLYIGQEAVLLLLCARCLSVQQHRRFNTNVGLCRQYTRRHEWGAAGHRFS